MVIWKSSTLFLLNHFPPKLFINSLVVKGKQTCNCYIPAKAYLSYVHDPYDKYFITKSVEMRLFHFLANLDVLAGLHLLCSGTLTGPVSVIERQEGPQRRPADGRPDGETMELVPCWGCKQPQALLLTSTFRSTRLDETRRPTFNM